MVNDSSLITQFIKKFGAKVVIPDDGKVCQLDVGHNRITIARSTRSLPPGTEFMVRRKNLSEILERDVWDVPKLADAKLIEDHYRRTVPVGSFRPKGGKQSIIYPTGILPVDSALVCGGFFGRVISRIWGASEGGKSLILYMTMITAWQLYRKHSLLINPEFDFDENRLLGLPGAEDVIEGGALEVYEPGNGTDAYDEALDKIASGNYGVVGFDSITPLKAAAESSKRMQDTEKIAAKASIQSRFLDAVMPVLYHQSNTALITVVQARKGISATYGSFDQVSGSYVGGGARQAASDALQFDAQQSIKINAASKVQSDSNKNMTGHLCTGWVDKNKRAPKGRRFEFAIDYAQGLDLERQIVGEALKVGIIELKGTKHIIGDRTFKNSKECRKALRNDRDFRRDVYTAVLRTINPGFQL